MNALELLNHQLARHTTLRPEEVDRICRHFEPFDLEREMPLFLAGRRYDKLVFVAEGILRLYVVDDRGEEVVKNFLQPPTFFADVESVEKHQPSRINVCSVTPCRLLTLSPRDAAYLTEQLPAWEILRKAGTLQAMSEMIRTLEFLRIGDAASQYRHLVEHFPQVVRDVPLKYIASFLRITPSSLSRIRRNIA